MFEGFVEVVYQGFRGIEVESVEIEVSYIRLLAADSLTLMEIGSMRFSGSGEPRG